MLKVSDMMASIDFACKNYYEIFCHTLHSLEVIIIEITTASFHAIQFFEPYIQIQASDIKQKQESKA